MDKIKIKKLQVETVIGVFDWEREVKQLLSIDIELEVNTKKAGKTDNIKEQIQSSIPLGRLGTPDDVASLVCYLVSEEAGYITGQTFNVDGGMVMI